MDTFQSSFLLPRRRVLFVALFIVYGVIVFFGFSQTASAACTPGDYSCGHWERSDGVTIYASTYYTAGCDDPWNASFDDCYAGSWSTEHLEWPSIWKTNPYVPPAGPVGMCTCEWFDTTDQPNELCTTHMGTPYPLSNPVSEAYCESRNVECSSTSGLGGTIGQGWGYRGCGWVQNPQCSDNIENDSDGFIDYPNDPDCTGPTDPTETPQFPDLIVGPTNTSNVAYGNTTPFSATVTNSGNATASNFPNIFQVANSDISNTIAYVPAQTIATLGASASNGISASYALPVGSYNVRACTNRDTNFAIGISESNQDNNCGASWVAFTVTNTAPDPPTLTCPASATINQVSTNFTFSSIDPEGDTIKYQIDWGEGLDWNYPWIPPTGYVNSGVSQNATHTWTSTGPKTVQVRAFDSNGIASAIANCNVSVTAANVAPTANAGIDRPITLPTNSVVISGASENDTDGTIASRTWTKQSGPAATITNGSTLTPTFSALTAGTYIFRLTVTDNGGLIGFDEMTVVVTAADLLAGSITPTNVTAGFVGTLSPAVFHQGK